MKLKKLLKFFYVLLVLGALFKLQYQVPAQVDTAFEKFSANSNQPFSPFNNNSPSDLPNSYQGFMRMEIFLLFFLLLALLSFTFKITENSVIKFFFTGNTKFLNSYFQRIKGRAPPLISYC